MSECSTKKATCILFASLAVNLFMFGFVAGKVPFGHPPHPPFEKRFDRDDRGPGPRAFDERGEKGPREFGRRGHDGPPPFMGGGLFTQKELEADKPFIDARLSKVRDLRKEFAEQLKKGPLTAEQINAHFVATDTVMDELKDHLHKKMIDKLTSMTPEEREKFADRSIKFEERAEKRREWKEERRAKGGDQDKDRGKDNDRDAERPEPRD